jgi:hypothetical protein
MQSDTIQRRGCASSNYAANVMVFDPRGPGTLTSSMTDGTSNTVTFVERYRNCSPSGTFGGGCTLPAWAWNNIVNGGDCWSSPTFNGGGAGVMSCSNNASTADGSVALQAGPSVQQCNWHVTQGGHAGTMQVGLGDGSVRGVSESMSTIIWTRACNPSDGQPFSFDN